MRSPPKPGPRISEASSQPFFRQTISCRQPCELMSGKPSMVFHVMPLSVDRMPAPLTNVPRGVCTIGINPCIRPSPNGVALDVGRIEYERPVYQRHEPLL